MSISSLANKNSYIGTGLLKQYSYTFRIFTETDLRVTVYNTDGDDYELDYASDYTVAGATNLNGGSITLIDTDQPWLTGAGNLITGYSIVIERVLPLTQETDLRNQGTYFPASIEDQFDRCIMIDQQQQSGIDRSIKIRADDDTTIDLHLPLAEDRANGYLVFDSNGKPIVVFTVPYANLVLTGSIVNADVSASAAIARSKLETGPANRVIINNASGVMSGAAAITAARVLISDANGIPAHSSVTTTTLGYLDATSSIQTQINTKITNPMTTGGDVIYGGGSGVPTRLANGTAGQYLRSQGTTLAPAWTTFSLLNADVNAAAAIARSKLANGTANRVVVNNGSGVMADADAITADRVLISDADGIPTASGVPAATIEFLDATSSVQNQLDSKMTNPMTTGGDLIYGGASGAPARLPNGVAGQVLISQGTTDPPIWSTPGGGGDVLGAASSVDGQLARFDGTSGKALKATPALISNADVDPAAAINYTKLNLAASIVDADVDPAAAVARTKLASGSNNHVLINDGSGGMSSEATLAKSRGGTGADNSSVTFPASGTIAVLGSAQTFSADQTFSAQVIGKAGSTSSTSFSFASDPNTGMYQVAGDRIGFAAGGAAIGSTNGSAWTLGTSGTAAAHTIMMGTSSGSLAVSDGTTSRVSVEPTSNRSRFIAPSGQPSKVITQVNDTTNSSYYLFGDSANDEAAGLQYQHSVDTLFFNISTTSMGAVALAGWTIGQSATTASHLIQGGNNARASSVDFVLQIKNVSAGTGSQEPGLIIFQRSNGTTVGGIYKNASADTVSYSTSSDGRRKFKQKNLSGALAKVMALKPSVYEWKSSPGREDAGFIAQELHEVYPWAVAVGGQDEKENPWGIDYGRLTPLLAAAIQEQQKMIIDLQGQIEALKDK